MLLLTLPGTAMLYYGDELGMEDVHSSGNLTTAWVRGVSETNGKRDG